VPQGSPVLNAEEHIITARTVTAFGGLAVFCLAIGASGAAELDREKLRKQLMKHEGSKSKVYKDSEGIPTIGVGFNLDRPDDKAKIESFGVNYDKVKAGREELSQAQISKLLEANIDSAIADCKAVFPKCSELSDVRQRALVDMMFNLGRGRFEKFGKMVAAVKAGDFAKAADEMKKAKWYEQVKTRGKTLEYMMRNDKERH
jgi:GH24 family phage-related lysozyme (muramidase)